MGDAAGTGLAVATRGMAPSLQPSLQAAVAPAAQSSLVPAGASRTPSPEGRELAPSAALKGSRLDLSKLQDLAPKGQEGEKAQESATGGIGAALLDVAGKTADRVGSLINRSIRGRDDAALVEMSRADRLVVVVMVRQQRAEQLRRTREMQGLAERVRREQLQRERAAGKGAEGARDQGAAQRRSRSTAEQMRARTIDGGTLRSQRAPGVGPEAGVRSIADARRAIAAPGRTVEGQSRPLGMTARGAGQAPTGQVQQMRLAEPRQAPQQLRLAPPQTVDNAPSAPARAPAMGAQRNAGIAAAVSWSAGR